ncbi:MAG: LysR family transcriptional regulator [Beijerinckiaceae bacterium]
MDKLKAMTVFAVVARRQNLSQAAKELGVSRPLVSHQLRLIEEHLGTRLINRTSRQFSLTQAGAEYLELCKSVIAVIEEKEALISQFQASPRGQLRVASSLAFGNYELAPIAAAFIAKYPQVSLSLFGTDNHMSSRQLVDQSFDVAFVMNPVSDSATGVARRVGAVRWLVCAAPTYLRLHEQIRIPADLTKHNCVSHRSFVPPNVWRFSRPDGLEDVPVSGNLYSNSVMVLRAAALQGVGIAMLPLYCVADDLAGHRLVQLLADFEAPAKPVYAVYPHATVPQKCRMFVEFCRRELRRMEAARSAAVLIEYDA